MTRILVIDDDPAIGRSLEIQLTTYGHETVSADTAGEGLEKNRSWKPELVFLDLQLPDRDGLELLPELLALESAPLVVVVTGKQDMKSTITAVRGGAMDYIRKPLDLDEILLAVEKAERLQAERRSRVVPLDSAEPAPREIVGRSRGIMDVLKKIARYSAVRVNVLVEGESGTGKELVARAIHEASTPAEPFVAVNCVALAPGVWESEMFGHEKGSFTGADRRHVGKLESAGEGTLFLDEIGDLAQEIQGKLLRVIQERVFERVGGSDAIPFQARLVAATHRDLHQMVADGSFREDLLHRLEVARIRVVPLRERREDVVLLVQALLRRISLALGRPTEGIAEPALRRLQDHDWPGNVRELENVLMRSVALSRGPVLTTLEMPEDASDDAVTAAKAESRTDGRSDWCLREVECVHIRRALEHHDWNITHCARALEISPTTLRKKIRDYGLKRG